MPYSRPPSPSWADTRVSASNVADRLMSRGLMVNAPALWQTLLPADLPVERVAARLGLISDTHLPERCPALPPSLARVFAGVDLILHAGDLGALSVLDRLSAIAPVVAVHG